ncbi:uncharacterized protein LOC143018030 [Oratosquilla oratoria]|uniref:uncharacterized protein LOC143018030 n=1 Tax=Oratosquilla oratoria TaxID=337810 RepID=UPI003F760681
MRGPGRMVCRMAMDQKRTQTLAPTKDSGSGDSGMGMEYARQRPSARPPSASQRLTTEVPQHHCDPTAPWISWQTGTRRSTMAAGDLSFGRKATSCHGAEEVSLNAPATSRTSLR